MTKEWLMLGKKKEDRRKKSATASGKGERKKE
jgi:hypothetical protein